MKSSGNGNPALPGAGRQLVSESDDKPNSDSNNSTNVQDCQVKPTFGLPPKLSLAQIEMCSACMYATNHHMPFCILYNTASYDYHCPDFYERY